MKIPVRVVLNGDDFADLVLGKQVDKEGAEIILSDIGFDMMRKLIDAAIVASYQTTPIGK